MRFFVHLLLLSISVSVFAQEKVWEYKNKRDLMADRIQFYSPGQNKFDHNISTTEKTPDKNNSLEIKIISSAPKALSYSKLITFRYDGKISKGQKIKLSFYYKGSVEGKLGVVAAQSTSPYKSLGKTAGKTLNISTEWQLAEITFTASQDFNPPLAMPRLMPGEYPVGGVLYFGPVKMEVLQTILPLSLNKEWKLLKNPDSQISLTTIPANAQAVELKDDKLDLVGNDPVKTKDAAILYNEFSADADGFMQIGMAADWWFECFVNGKKVYSTMDCGGNSTERVVPQDQVFNFPVKQGKNIMAVKVYSGSRGWTFAAGKVPFLEDPKRGSIYTINQSAEFRPVDMDKMLIKKGTALDFSELNGKRPDMDKSGSIIINKNGKFAYQNAPEEEIRFLSFNFLPSYWRLKAHTWTHKDIEKFAEGVANQGYNMVRFHCADRFLLGYKVHNRPLRDISQTGLPQTAAEIEFDKGNYDRFDYMLACFKKHGVYINLDLMTSSTGYSMAYRAKIEEKTKLNNFFDKKYRNHWKVAVESVLNHVNPYTKTALKDDPILACVNFCNEQDIQLGNKIITQRFATAFREWLKKKYGSDAALSKAWGGTVEVTSVELDENLLRQGNQASKDAGTFLTETMNEMTSWYLAQVREIGYKGMFNMWDMIMRTMELPVRATLPTIAQHTYYDHPNKINTKGIVKKTKFDDNKKSDIRMGQGSSLSSSYFRSAAAVRFLDRPYMITEYSQSFPNQYRHERGLYFGSYAALQGWDNLTPHEDMVRPMFWEPIGSFESAHDPISRASETVAALVWARSDVKESPHTVALELKSDKMFPKNYLAAIGDEYARMSLITKIGILYPEVKPAMPVGKAPRTDMVIIPENFTPLRVKQWYVSAGIGSDQSFMPILAKLRKSGIIGKNNRTSVKNHIYQSDTGELLLDIKNNTMQVTTPRLEGVILKKNQSVKLNTMRVKSLSSPASIVAASLNKDTSLKDSKRILLIVAGNAFNTGMVFEDKFMSRVCSLGTLPPLVQSLKCSITLNTTQKNAPEVYALYMDGTRAQKLSSTFKDGKLSLNLDTSKLKYGTPYFEIVY